MNVTVYVSGKPWAAPAENAMADGLARHGLAPVRRAAGDWAPCDVAIVWAHRDADLHAMQRAAGAHYLVMERGHIGDLAMRRAWTSLGFDGLNGRATRPDLADPDRFERHFGHLLRPWRAEGDYLLLMGQVPGDAAVAGTDIERWYAETAERIALTAGLPVVYRPHPMAGPVRDVPGTLRLEGRLDGALDGAAAVATWNSNSAVDAVLAGVPTWACDAGSMAWAVAGHDLAQLPPRPDRSEWAARLAWCQWTLGEMADGTAWEANATCL